MNDARPGNSKSDLEPLFERLRDGDSAAAASLFAKFHDRLEKMVCLRLDRRLQGRFDASDVLQDAYLEIQKKVSKFASTGLPAYLWMRLIVCEKLVELRRRHLETKKRDAWLEVSIYRGRVPLASTNSLASLLLGSLTSPSQAAIRAEQQLRLEEALNQMKPIDREIIVLRHFEELNNSEVAAVLDLSQSAASNRYIRALGRIKNIFTSLHGTSHRSFAE